MKIVNCDLFKQGEYLMFNAQRLAEFESAIGQPIGQLLQSGVWPLNAIVVGYSIGMKQSKRQPQAYYELIDGLFEAGNTIAEIQMPLVKAVVASGIMGQKAYYDMFPDEMTEADRIDIEVEAQKAKN